MADKRTDRLAENRLQQAKDRIEAALQDLKSNAPQFISGSNISYVQSDTGAGYDWSGHLAAAGGGGQGLAVFLVTATAQNMTQLYANIFDILFVGSPTTQYRPGDAYADVIAGGLGFTTAYIPVPLTTTTLLQNQWVVYLQGDTSRMTYLKFYVAALDTVTISLTRLS